LEQEGETYADALQRFQAAGLISRAAERPFRAASASEAVRTAPDPAPKPR